MNARFIGKRPVLEGANLATEELNQAMHFLGANLLPLMRAARVAADAAGARAQTAAPADAPATRDLVRIVQPGKKAAIIVPSPLPENRT